MEKRAILKKTEVVKTIFDELGKILTVHGFVTVKNEFLFKKQNNDSEYRVLISLASFGPIGHHIGFNFYVKNRALTTYLEKFEKEYYNHEREKNNGARYNQDQYNLEYKKYEVKYEEDISKSLENFVLKFSEIGLPFFERFSSLEAMERECNKDFEPFGIHFAECIDTGIGLAKITERKDLTEIAQGYKQALLSSKDGIESRIQERVKKIDALVAFQG